MKQDAINFFIRQLVNWLQLVEIRNPSSNDKGIRDPVLRVRESEFAAWHPESTLSYHHPYSHLAIHEDFKFKRFILYSKGSFFEIFFEILGLNQ